MLAANLYFLLYIIGIMHLKPGAVPTIFNKTVSNVNEEENGQTESPQNQQRTQVSIYLFTWSSFLLPLQKEVYMYKPITR